MKRGFTLIELLASMTLFLLIIAVGAAIVTSASGVARTTKQRTALRKEAREVFDRMALDLASAVRFESYQIRTSSGTNDALALLARSSQRDDTRLQRIDYRVSTNGVYRAVSPLGWEDTQDLSFTAEGPGEQLSPHVGNMMVQIVFSDGTIATDTDTPSLRTTLRPIGLRVGLALTNPTTRAERRHSPPQFVTNTTSHGISIPPEAEIAGWRVSEKFFRLP